MTSNTSAVSPSSARSNGLYRLIWRWHFYAGLFCIPIVLTLSVSGAIYLFKPQIDNFVESPLRTLDASQQRTTANEQIRAAQQALPGSRFSSYRLPESNSEAVAVSVMHKGERALVYIDPYSLQPLKKINHDEQFINQVRSLHGELLAGDVGSILVELAGCWAIVLILTGLYLWWPRSAAGMAGVVYPRWSTQPSTQPSKRGRIFWRDLHAVTGFWLSIALLFLLLSGLPWATVWGGAFKEARAFIANLEGQDWTTSITQAQRMWRKTAVTDVDLSPTLLASARGLQFAPPAELSVVDAATNKWQLASNHQNRTLRAAAMLDGKSGEVLLQTTFAQRPLVDRIIGIGISIHEGHLFGWLNQALGLIVAFGAFVIASTGLVMWWQRKPTGRLGAPTRIPNANTGRAAAAILFALALFLPLLALSVIA